MWWWTGFLEGVTGNWYDDALVGNYFLAKHLTSVEGQSVDEQGLL